MKQNNNIRSFNRSLPMSLLRAREAVMKKFIPHLRSYGLSPQQWRVLRALYESEGLKMTEISNSCFLLMPSLSRIVQNLVSRELVQRRVSPKDQRQAIINLTEKGVVLFKLMSVESESRYAHITQTFGYGKLELLSELLDELVQKLDVVEPKE
jgi:homoprotocatechuate degradation regulator HpaR